MQSRAAKLTQTADAILSQRGPANTEALREAISEGLPRAMESQAASLQDTTASSVDVSPRFMSPGALSLGYASEELILPKAWFTAFAIPPIELVSASEIMVNSKAYSVRS